MAAKKLIFVSQKKKKKSRDQNLKNCFPDGILQWNLAQSWRTWTHSHFWNKICKKKKYLFKNGGQSILWDMRNNAIDVN